MATINKKGIAQVKGSDAEASSSDNATQEEQLQNTAATGGEDNANTDVSLQEGVQDENKSEEGTAADQSGNQEVASESAAGSEPPAPDKEAPASEQAVVESSLAMIEPGAAPVIKPVVEQTPEAPVVQQVAEVVQPEQEVPQQSTVFKSPHQGHAQAPVLDYLDRVRDSGTVIQKRALFSIEKLNNAIRPKVMIGNKEFVTEQREFFRAMLWALELPQEEFSAAWNIYQKFFQAHHDVNGVFGNNSPREYTSLSEYRLYQTPAKEWGNRSEEYESFKMLTALLRTLRNPETRNVEKKTIDFNRLVDGRFVKEVSCDKLKQFYDV